MNNIQKAVNQSLSDFVSYTDGGVTSKAVISNAGGSITFFSFDKGQALSEHSAPFDAFVQVLDGKVEIKIGGEPKIVSAGEFIIMPGNVPHALKALEKFKMLLVMIKAN